jgi:hypothetical protein
MGKTPPPPWVQLQEVITKLGLVATKLDSMATKLDSLAIAMATRQDGFRVLPLAVESGIASGGTEDKLYDRGKVWAEDIFRNFFVAIISGTGAGQIRTIASNDYEALTVKPPFQIPADSTSAYVILLSSAINITAQDLANLVINIAAQSVGIYLQPEWAAKEGKDKNFLAYSAGVVPGDGPSIVYTVPAGKTLYITQIAWFSCAADGADRELNQMCSSLLYNATTDTFYQSIGGNGGGSCIYNKPYVIPAGQQIQIYCTNESNHTTNAYITAQGYEV